MARSERIQHTASLAPRTVQAVSTSVIQAPTRRPRRPVRTTAPAGAVDVVRIAPEVWATALDLADGDVARIEIISETAVRVHNGPGWRQEGAVTRGRRRLSSVP